MIQKASDLELLGLPYIIIVGRDAKEGKVEFKDRYNGTTEIISVEELLKRIA